LTVAVLVAVVLVPLLCAWSPSRRASATISRIGATDGVIASTPQLRHTAIALTATTGYQQQCRSDIAGHVYSGRQSFTGSAGNADQRPHDGQ